MNNVKLMKKVTELETQVLHNREQSLKIMVQVAVLKWAYGVKNGEINQPIKDYERSLVQSDEEIRKEFDIHVRFMNGYKKVDNIEKSGESERILKYIVEILEFFRPSLAKQLEQERKLLLQTN